MPAAEAAVGLDDRAVKAEGEALVRVGPVVLQGGVTADALLDGGECRMHAQVALQGELQRRREHFGDVVVHVLQQGRECVTPGRDCTTEGRTQSARCRLQRQEGRSGRTSFAAQRCRMRSARSEVLGLESRQSTSTGGRYSHGATAPLRCTRSSSATPSSLTLGTCSAPRAEPPGRPGRLGARAGARLHDQKDMPGRPAKGDGGRRQRQADLLHGVGVVVGGDGVRRGPGVEHREGDAAGGAPRGRGAAP